jgi:Tfp pilus assembly protein PilX
MRHFTGCANKQKGMTLLVAMITLIMLMLLGLSAMQASNTMSKLAGNLQFQNEAMNRAETALIAGENMLLTGTNSQDPLFFNLSTTSTGTTAKPYYGPNATLTQNLLTTWPTAASVDAAGTEQFIIQLISANKLCPPGQNCLSMGGQGVAPPTQYYLFRVTARGQTMRGAVRYVESIVQVPAP